MLQETMNFCCAPLYISAIAVLFIPFHHLTLVEAGKLLVVPMDGSHWLSMRAVLDLLHQRGHHVVVVAPESTIHVSNSPSYELKLYPVSFSQAEMKKRISSFSSEVFIPRPFLQKLQKIRDNLKQGAVLLMDTCIHLLNNSHLIQFLEESSFDAIFTDPMLPCGQILAEHLAVPSVYFMSGIPCNLDSKASKSPLPKSYVPQMSTGLTDHMTFTERVKNILYEPALSIFCNDVFLPYQEIASKFLKKEVILEELLSHGAIWLMRQDFVLNFPKPVMPQMVFIGGINCVKTKPLTKEFEQLVNSSGEHGFVVFSLGSMVSEIPIDKAIDIAKALGSIPQKVFWRYTGKVPPNLAENTHLVKWLPQNDLLAHPKARAFITHAGSHGIYEAICNAVPVVMLPLFGDQMDNAVRIEARGAGVTLNVLDMTSEDLSNALKNVIENPSYKKNIERLSALHLDRPIHPLDLAVYWVEFVMRHKGAPHLRPAAHDLNFFQYHSLDVIGFLLLVIITTLFISLKCSCMVFRRCCGRRSSPKSKSKSKSKPE
ncbi:UDP-glucuronosyltransferase 1A5-like isoform X2 [Pelobates fuscus]|uniref:UDP-glucuronosyltransferase 1A5-like isoform X2 n=1 Tax=Pelobates fuscus TaxID=191477 RepID=UPI002FE42CB5